MNYQVLVHHVFEDPAIYNVDMEHDLSLITQSPVYAENQALIDEFVAMEELFRPIFREIGKVTKFVSPDRTEQVVQIECTRADADLFLLHPAFPQFLDLRMLVGDVILQCVSTDLVTVSEEPTVTYDSYESVRAQFE